MGALIDLSSKSLHDFAKKTQWEHSYNWDGPIRYNSDSGKVIRYSNAGEALSVKNIHNPYSLYSAGSFLTRTFCPHTLSDIPIILNPISKISIILGKQGDEPRTRPLCGEYTMLNGRVAVVYSYCAKKTYIIHTYMDSSDLAYRKIDIYGLDMVTERIDLIASTMRKYDTDKINTEVQFNPSGILYIIDKLGSEFQYFKLTKIDIVSGSIDANTMITPTMTETEMPSMLVGNNITAFHQNKGQLKNNFMGLKFRLVDTSKIGNVVFSYYTGGIFISLITDSGEFHKYDISENMIIGCGTSRITKGVDLYKRLQKYFGGIDALNKENSYVVSIYKRDLEFFIDCFDLPDNWNQKKIKINTKAFAAGKSIVVTFQFAGGIQRDYIIARKVWNKAFVEKGNKKKLLMNYPIFSAMSKLKV